jgi:hypothetical protein
MSRPSENTIANLPGYKMNAHLHCVNIKELGYQLNKDPMRTDTTNNSSSAIIITFPRKRGRPKTRHNGCDTGTPELVMKRLRGETAEALDVCLERGIIAPEQHRAGIHLRWLYTVRYGAPGLRAIDPTHLGGLETANQDSAFKAAREKDYQEAIRLLHNHNKAALIANLCIFNERPKFLNLHERVTDKRAHEAAQMLADIRFGLDLLVKLWKRE